MKHEPRGYTPTMTPTRKLVTSLLLVLSLGGATAACSANGDVDEGEDGDGVEIQGDVDQTEDE